MVLCRLERHLDIGDGKGCERKAKSGKDQAGPTWRGHDRDEHVEKGCRLEEVRSVETQRRPVIGGRDDGNCSRQDEQEDRNVEPGAPDDRPARQALEDEDDDGDEDGSFQERRRIEADVPPNRVGGGQCAGRRGAPQRQAIGGRAGGDWRTLRGTAVSCSG